MVPDLTSVVGNTRRCGSSAALEICPLGYKTKTSFSDGKGSLSLCAKRGPRD